MQELSQNSFQAICEAAHDAILLVNEKGRITYANKRVQSLFGYEPNELTGEQVEILVPEKQRDAHVKHRNEYLAEPVARPMGADLELSAQRKDGSTIPVDIGLSPIADSTETRVVVIVRDIREQKSFQARYRQILEAVPDPVLVADTDTGVIIEANNHVYDLIGYRPTELRGKPQSFIHPTEEKEKYETLFQRHISDNTAIYSRFPDGSPIFIETNDCELVPVEINAHVFTLDDQTLIAGVFRDVTRRQEYERQLSALHEATRDLIDASTCNEIADLVISAANTILGYSRTVVRFVEDESLKPVALTEQARSDLGGRPDYALHEDIPASNAYRQNEPLYYPDIDDIPDEHDRGDATSVMYLPIGNFGVLSIIDTAYDAFDQTDLDLASILAANAESALQGVRDTRELERQNNRLDEFVGVVSHDLRNPLNVAMGWLETANDKAELEELARVETALNRMDDIISDTLVLARQGKTLGKTEKFDIHEVISLCWDMVATEHASLSLTESFTIEADTNRFQHLLENLFRNAIEHGGSDVTVSIGPLDSDGFYVEDSGPGIPEDNRETIFETGYSTERDGTGLGLPIVKQIADAHGWDIRITTGTKGGARFEFTNVVID